MKLLNGNITCDDLASERARELQIELDHIRRQKEKAQEQLAIALDALLYCSVEPGIEPMRESQRARAAMALARIKEVA